MQQVVEDNILMARKNDIRAIEANLKPLGRNLSSSQMCTLRTMKNLRFSILLKALACSCTIIGLGECNIIPQILRDP